MLETGHTADIYDVISIVFSLGGGAVALLSLYFSFLKQGLLTVLPVRMYKVDPWTSNGDRTLKLTIPLTFLNTGAGQKTVPDLRVRVKTPSGNMLLAWVEELDGLPVFQRQTDEASRRYPFQPTLKAYESLSRVYGFQSASASSTTVQALDDVEGGNALPAFVEIRTGPRHWRTLRRFTLHYAGSIAIEDDFERING